MSVLSRLKPAALASTVVVASGLLAPVLVHAQDVTVLRGSPSRLSQSPPDSSIDCNNPYYYQYCQDNQSSDYNTSSGYGDDYPYYGDDFSGGVGRRFPHRRGFHGRLHAGFHGGGLHTGFHSGGFHGGGFHGGGLHGGGGHR